MSNVVPLNQPQVGFFDYPQPSADLAQIMYAQPPGYLSPPPQSSYQLCELVYTPINTPSGVALAPSLVPLSPREGILYPTPMPSPVASQVGGYAHPRQTPRQNEGNGAKANTTPRMNDLVHGIPAEQWKAMTDKEREDFVKAKRRLEAFKTALCQGFMKSGECKFGVACRFAHGKNELRLPKYNHPKYKTVLCRTYAVTGECPYGSRCQFIHEKYQGQIPEEYVMSVESTTYAKKPQPPRRKPKTYRNVQFADECNGVTGTEVREAKKELCANNEKTSVADLTESFDKLFDAKKFLSRSYQPRIGHHQA